MSNDHVYGKLEITGSSKNSIEEAVQTAIKKATEKVKNLRWFEVIETRGYIENNAVAYWQVTVKIGYTMAD